jgi:hypothetical protein
MSISDVCTYQVPRNAWKTASDVTTVGVVTVTVDGTVVGLLGVPVACCPTGVVVPLTVDGVTVGVAWFVDDFMR